MRIIVLLFVSTFCLLGCKTESNSVENADKSISVNYYLRNYQTGNFVKAETKFKYELDTGHIAVKSGQLQDKQMRVKGLENAITWCGYEGELDTAQGFDFKFQLDNDITVTHTLPLKPVKSFKIKGEKVIKSKGFVFEWEGSKIESNETLILFFTDSKGNPVTMNRVMTSADSGFEVNPPLLTGLAAGKSQFYVVRRSRIDLPEEGNIKGVAELEYYTDAIEVMIEE